MIFKVLLLCIVLFQTLPVQALLVTKEVVGHGSTEDEAISDGLCKAIQQITGVNIDTNTLSTLNNTIKDADIE